MSRHLGRISKAALGSPGAAAPRCAHGDWKPARDSAVCAGADSMNATKAVDARDASGGLIQAVTDRDILQAYRLLARQVGVFVELASAASVAGLLQATADGAIPAGSRVVCTVTGHGLKDPEWAISTAPAPTTIPADVLAAARHLNLA